MSDSGQLDLQVPTQPAWGPGHFPGDALMPGAHLLDAVIHGLRCAGAIASANDDQPCVVAQTKFTAPVRPGDTIRLNWSSTDTRLRFECTVADVSVASGQLVRPES